MNVKTPGIAWVLFFILSLIWGSSFILIKKGLVALSAEEVASIRITAASLVLLPFALGKFNQFNKKNILPLLSAGLMGSLIPAFLFAIAQTRLPSAITGIMNSLTPFFTIIISVLFFAAKPAKRVYVGIAMGFIGTLFLILGRTSGNLSINYYALFVVAASLLYGINANIIKHYLNELKSITVASLSLVIVGPVAFIYLLFFTPFMGHIQSPEVLLATGYILILGVFGTALALVLFNKMVQLTGALFAASVTYLIPLVAVSWGVLDGENISLIQVLSMVVIIVGVFIANSKRA